MTNKQELLAMLREELDQWEALLAGLSEEQLTTPRSPDTLAIKDEVAHLMAWQQRSIARIEAAALSREPQMPEWPQEFDLEYEDDLDRINAWIYDSYHELPWKTVYREWRTGFERLIELAEFIPEEDLMQAGRYPWMEGRALSEVLEGTWDHHREEHREALMRWLGE